MNQFHARKPHLCLGRSTACTQKLWRAAISLGLFCAGCGDDGGDNAGMCVEGLPQQCEATIDPTYVEIYDKIIAQRCGATDTGTACHGKNGLKANLGLFNADVAYAALLGQDATKRARVLPNDPSCSILVERLESKDAGFRMPLGEQNPLSPGLRCAIQQWINAGAPK